MRKVWSRRVRSGMMPCASVTGEILAVAHVSLLARNRHRKVPLGMASVSLAEFGSRGNEEEEGGSRTFGKVSFARFSAPPSLQSPPPAPANFSRLQAQRTQSPSARAGNPGPPRSATGARRSSLPRLSPRRVFSDFSYGVCAYCVQCKRAMEPSERRGLRRPIDPRSLSALTGYTSNAVWRPRLQFLY